MGVYMCFASVVNAKNKLVAVPHVSTCPAICGGTHRLWLGTDIKKNIYINIYIYI